MTLGQDEGYRNLANAIVIDAAQDWMNLIKRDPHSKRIADLRQFFKSDWCAVLCGDANPQYILERLEKERTEEIERQEEKQCI